jgi:predicted 3-demethylubiquinone-9 3-methyltransferase (glyoxalase superfamily)
MNKVTPFLWFDNNAEEAMNFYASVFRDAKIVDVQRYGEGGPAPAGTVMTGTMQIHGQDIMVLNGGPAFKFNESFSLFVDCEDQAEVDDLWGKLTADGGEESMCGWLKDKFGLSWQIIPKRLGELLGDRDPDRAAKAMQAMPQMRKIDVAKLEEAVSR